MRDKPTTKDFCNELGEVLADYVYSSLKTCLRCTHFTEKSEICEAYNQRPPARVIAFGCESFDEQLPF